MDGDRRNVRISFDRNSTKTFAVPFPPFLGGRGLPTRDFLDLLSIRLERADVLRTRRRQNRHGPTVP